MLRQSMSAPGTWVSGRWKGTEVQLRSNAAKAWTQKHRHVLYLCLGNLLGTGRWRSRTLSPVGILADVLLDASQVVLREHQAKRQRELPKPPSMCMKCCGQEICVRALALVEVEKKHASQLTSSSRKRR